jgi:dihydrodiol dehydrogenase / D-xylose 1-dehydrogenase (NADP)
MKPIGWGILATGNIAHSMARALRDSDSADIVAVASRAQERADAFGEEWGISKRYGTYEALVGDPGVEVVYVATPHSRHYEHMLLCLDAGKHVLCEKAFTLNARQASECIALARQKSLFLMEAMWMRFFPAMAQVRDWVRRGVLGDVRLVQADLGLYQPFDPEHRLFNPELGGGALLDLGIYPLSFATMVLGFPERVEGHAHLGHTGVDELDTILLAYENGASAVLACTTRAYKPREAFVVGTKGYIRVHDVFLHPECLTLDMRGEEPLTMSYPFASNGYIHEVEEVHACLTSGRTESEIMPLDETLGLMELMDGLRAEWGVAYPGE